VGNKPEKDYSMQATLVETNPQNDNIDVIGIPIGSSGGRVDMTFNPDSENAQSGKAISDELNNYPKYESNTEWIFDGGNSDGNIRIDEIIDSEMSDESLNPVANNTIKAYIDNATEETRNLIDNATEETRNLIDNADSRINNNNTQINDIKNRIELEADYVVEQGTAEVEFTTTAINKPNNATTAIDPSKPDDAIVEVTKNAIWRYRKWASGRAECWTSSCGMATHINTNWGSLYISEHTFPQIDFPFNMAVGGEAPVCNFDLSYTTSIAGYVFASAFDANNNFKYNYNKIPEVYAWNPNNLGAGRSIEITARVFVIGRWR
jgi:vacuolar-type H+-ATPase subunit H